MSKMKKVLLMCTAYVLVAVLAIGGTLAYLTDTDSAVNVMTVGNVSIKQHEYERVVENGKYKTEEINGVTSYVLQNFTQGKPLLPATEIDANGLPYNYGAGDYDSTRVKMSQVGSHGSMDVFVNENAQDKFVTVENTGRTDAYVRTIIAYELGSVENFNDVIMTSCFMTAQGVWKVTDIGAVEIDGNNYFVAEYIYNGAAHDGLGGVHANGVLPAGDTTYPSLAQVYMKATATNEDVEALDGNKNGAYDILVLSQAVQAAGFADAKTALDTAFGTSSEKAAEWFGGTAIPDVVASSDEAYDAFSAFDQSGKSGSVILNSDFNTADAENHWSSNREYALRAAGTDVTFDLNGHTVNHNTVYQNGKNTGYTYLFTTAYNGKLTVNGEGGSIYSENTAGHVSIFYAQGPSEIVINGGEYHAVSGIPVWAGNGAKVTINGGKFTSSGSDDEELIYSSGGIIDIYGGFFHNTEQDNRPVNVANANRGTGFINIYGGTFVNFDPSTGGDDPNNIRVMDGYKVVSETQANGDVWYTVVAE